MDLPAAHTPKTIRSAFKAGERIFAVRSYLPSKIVTVHVLRIDGAAVVVQTRNGEAERRASEFVSMGAAKKAKRR